MQFLAPLVSKVLFGILTGLIEKICTAEVTYRVISDLAWHVAKKTDNNLDDKMANTLSKAIGYGYKPDLDK